MTAVSRIPDGVQRPFGALEPPRRGPDEAEVAAPDSSRGRAPARGHWGGMR